MALVVVAALADGAATAGAGVPTGPEALDAGASRPFVDSVRGRAAEVWAVGDGADGGPAADAVVALIERARPDRLLYLGDVYARGTETDFATHYAPSWGRLARVTAPTPGNHEWARRSEGYSAYWARARGRRPPVHYSFRVAGWQILSLNSEAAHGPRSPQSRWLRRAVAAPGDCRIAFWHRPRFSAGRHGDQRDTDPLWRPLRGRARIVLWGHDHHMQRLRVRSGIVPFVSGAGGAGLYRLDRSDPRLAFGADSTHGALRLRLRRGLARWAFVTAGGRTLDSGRVRCDRDG